MLAGPFFWSVQAMEGQRGYRSTGLCHQFLARVLTENVPALVGPPLKPAVHLACKARAQEGAESVWSLQNHTNKVARQQPEPVPSDAKPAGYLGGESRPNFFNFGGINARQ